MPLVTRLLSATFPGYAARFLFLSLNQMSCLRFENTLKFFAIQFEFCNYTTLTSLQMKRSCLSFQSKNLKVILKRVINVRFADSICSLIAFGNIDQDGEGAELSRKEKM